MKKFTSKLPLMLTALLITASASAQNINLQGPANNILNEVKAVFPIIVAIIFVIVVLYNLGHFTKEGGDWKKGVSAIVIYCVIVGVAVALFGGLASIHL